jgi:hypothetical protein
MSNKSRLIALCRDRGIACVTVGSAGGRREAAQVRTGDLGEANNDELLRQVRKKLRRDYGFASGAARGRMNFKVRCVWSEESPVFPWADGTCRTTPELGGNLRLDWRDWLWQRGVCDRRVRPRGSRRGGEADRGKTLAAEEPVEVFLDLRRQGARRDSAQVREGRTGGGEIGRMIGE